MYQQQQRQMHIGVLVYGCGHHQAAWQMPGSAVERLGDVSYYQELAQLAERGCLDIVFFADNQSFNANDSSAMPAFWFDPLINLTAISQVTQYVGLVPTISSTFSDPYTVARQLLSLDHMTGGRVGWNLVTSMTDIEAQNHSMTELPNHEARYARAQEFAAVMQHLFTNWKATDIVADKERGVLMNASQIKPIEFNGNYFQVRGPISTPQSPQGRPVNMQAGASKQGIALAARYADAVYAVSWNLTQAKRYRERLKQALSQTAEPQRHIKVFPGLVTYVGQTKEEALAKKKRLDAQLPVKTALKQLSFFIQQDCQDWNLDGPVPELPPIETFEGPTGRYETVLEIIKDKQPTVRELLGYLNAGGGHLTLIGTPKEIVDEMELCFNEGVADGFNLMPPSLPHSLNDFVTYIVPELQQRGLYRKRYQSHTLKSHLDINY